MSQYTPEELQRRAAQARGQRLKLFQSWFWQIVKQLPMSHNEGEILEGILEPHWQLYSKVPRYREYSDAITALVLKILKDEDTAKKRIEEVLRQFVDGDFDYFNQTSGAETPPHISRYLDNFKHSVDMRLQRQITWEAIGFLCSARGIEFLRAFSFNAIIPFFEDGLPQLDPQLILLCVDNAIAIVGLVPWATEFEKVKSRS